MNNQKIKEIIKFSLRKNIQNKWFIILNCFLFIITVVTLNASNINKFLESNNIKLFDDDIKIKYIDNENIIGDMLEKAFKEYDKIEVEKIAENNYTKDNIDNNIIVEIFPDDEEILTAKIVSKEGIAWDIYNLIEETLNNKRKEIFSQKNNISQIALEDLEAGVQIERLMIGVNSENSDKKQMIEYVSTMLVYVISIFMFSKIANDISQEKVSKSIEYVLTSVSAKEYLFAKIVSTVLIVLLQGIYLMVYFFIGNIVNNIICWSYADSGVSITNGILSNIDIDLVKYILVLFVYGILTIVLMAIIQAALSSKTTSMQEAGNSMMFLLTITVAVYLLTFYLITPYTNMSIWIYILSCVPLVSNYFVPAIMIIGQATTLQVCISLLILIVSIPISFNICSKVFKDGVLDYKQKKNKKSKNKVKLSLKEEQEISLEKAKFRRLGFVVSLGLILFIVLELIVDIILELLLTPILAKYLNDILISAIVQILVSAIGLSFASFFVHLYIPKKEKMKGIDSKQARKLVIISLVLVWMLQIILAGIQMLFGIENDMSSVILDVEGLDNIFNCILFFIETALAPAIFEELFFRKCLVDISREFGDKFAVVFSSLIFGIAHLNILQGIFAFFIGIILGTLYVKTEKMKYNCLLHFLNNGYAVLVTILSYNELDFYIFIFGLLMLVVIIFGAILLIREIKDKLKNKEDMKFLNGKLFPRNFKYILTDYTVIVSIIFSTVLFVATEVALKML